MSECVTTQMTQVDTYYLNDKGKEKHLSPIPCLTYIEVSNDEILIEANAHNVYSKNLENKLLDTRILEIDNPQGYYGKFKVKGLKYNTKFSIDDVVRYRFIFER